jgi:hypothetical protein
MQVLYNDGHSSIPKCFPGEFGYAKQRSYLAFVILLQIAISFAALHRIKALAREPLPASQALPATLLR